MLLGKRIIRWQVNCIPGMYSVRSIKPDFHFRFVRTVLEKYPIEKDGCRWVKSKLEGVEKVLQVNKRRYVCENCRNNFLNGDKNYQKFAKNRGPR
jgi:hypothetical protein